MWSSFLIYIVDPNDFQINENLSNSSTSNTFLVIQNDTHDQYVMKTFNNIDKSIIEDKFVNVCSKLKKNSYPCFKNISYISKPDFDNQIPPAIYTLYAQNKSLKNLLEQRNTYNEYDETQKYIILYGIIKFLKYFHHYNQIHGRLKLSNILLDDNFYPMITDPFINEFDTEKSHLEQEKNIDCFIYFSPELINNQPPSQMSDIYAFGIIALQVLSNKIDIYDDISNDIEQIKNYVLNENKPTIPHEIPGILAQIIDRCLSFNPDERPKAHEIKKIFKNHLQNDLYIGRFNDFRKSIIPKKDNIEPKLIEIKKKADDGFNDLDMIYTYGRARYFGERCNKNEKEGMDYIRYAAKKDHQSAKDLYELYRKDILQYNDNQFHYEEDDNEKDYYDYEYKSYNSNNLLNSKTDIPQIIKDVHNNLDKKVIFKFDQKVFEENNFIPTESLLLKFAIIADCIEKDIPILIEGPTGTSKTQSVITICQCLHMALIRYNFSSETKSTNMLRNYIGDQKTWSGLNILPGPLVEAYKNGNVLLFDEINLANPDCLQFLKDILVSNEICIDIPGMPYERIEKKPGFRLIATQNPKKGSFDKMRQKLGFGFLSRFKVITFDKFSEEELNQIASGLAKKFGYAGNLDIINDLVKLHMKWSDSPDRINDLDMKSSDDIQCLTIRELAATIKALSNQKVIQDSYIYDTVMTIYGARYEKEKRKKLEEMFLSFNSFKNCKPSKFTYPKDFPKCYQNENHANALKSIIFSLENNRPVILAGKKGVGISQTAIWTAQMYSNRHLKECPNKEYYINCTCDTQCSDLFGKNKPTVKMNSDEYNNEILHFEPGILTSAIKNGGCLILDNVQEVSPTVLERTNPIFDKKYDDNDNIFSIPENPKEPNIQIHKNFRIICTCNINYINHLSPAFINRFDVVVLEDQINYDENELKSLISILLEQNVYTETNEEEYDDFNEFNDGFVDFEIDDNENNNTNNEFQHENSFVPSKEMIDAIYQKIEKNKTMAELSEFCNTVLMLYQYLPQKINFEMIVDFSKDLLNKHIDFTIPEPIEKFLIQKLDDQILSYKEDSQFFFSNSPILKSFMAKIFACSIVGLNVCIHGDPGVGKTSAAREFARIRPIFTKSNEKYYMYSFTPYSRPSDFNGKVTLIDGKIELSYEPLVKAATHGCIFVADEMNCSTESTMKSLAPFLEHNRGRQLYISGISEPIKFDKNFFFIACQNESTAFGRNKLPATISARFRYFNFPEQDINDISLIGSQIAESLYKDGIIPSFSKQDSLNVGKYMIMLNKIDQKLFPKWSLRDINKIFHRIHYQDSHSESFIGMSIPHNLLFYTFSSVPEEDLNPDFTKTDNNNIFENIWNLICNIFNLNVEKRKNLHECYFATPTIDNQKSARYLMKGTCGVLFDFSEKVGNGLPSLLNTIFMISISSPNEPILIAGDTGYKTYVALLFLINAQVIPLNQESTLAQLLGKTTCFTKKEAKLFYLEYICKICHITNEYQNFAEKLKNKTLKKEDIEIYTLNYIKKNPSLNYPITHLTQKLFELNSNKYNNCVLSNLEIEFKPGAILTEILQQKPLILKHLTNLYNIIIERFNELFSGKHNLTLNEDFYNTFTDVNQKELDNTSFFRIIATCYYNTLAKLSDAFKSRLTVIYASEYKEFELPIVLKSYIESHNLIFDHSFIQLLINFAEKIKLHFKKPLSLLLLINTIEICSTIQKNSISSKIMDYIGIILFRLTYGLLEDKSDKNIKEKLFTIFDELSIPIPNEIKKIYSEEYPFSVTTIDGCIGLYSKITKFFINSPYTKQVDSKLAFTPMFSELLDILHLGFFTNTPVIFEGLFGQGKQTSIKYIAQLLGFSVLNVYIYASTKVEDLFGKYTVTRDKSNNIQIEFIEKKLLKVLKSATESSKTIIVFHGIENASSAVIQCISTIIDKHQEEIPLPDGTSFRKQTKMAHIVGIINPTKSSFYRDKLSSSSIYHIVNNPNNYEILSIISKLVDETKFKFDAKKIFERFIITKEYSQEINAEPVTLNDIIKYINFRKATYEIIDESIISLMTFAYRFLKHDQIVTLCQKIDQSIMKFIPVFSYVPEKRKIILKLSEQSRKGIVFNLPRNFDLTSIKSIESCLTGLTLSQRHCLVFLSLSVLTKRACMIQGDISGKSFLIRLFAHMLGMKLIVIQICKESISTILNGQDVLKDGLTENDIKDFQIALADLKIIPKINEYIIQNIPNSPNEWQKTIFTDLLEYINNFKETNEQISQEKLELIENAERKIFETIQPTKRFHHIESKLVDCMINGGWILFDAIENAPEFTNKIVSLCGPEPEFTFESRQNMHFSRKKHQNSHLIHEDFQIFFTYNPASAKNKPDPKFLNECLTFTNIPMDSTVENSAQILFGSLIQSYPKDFSVEMSCHMANAHNYMSNESLIDKESFAGENSITGITLKFVSKEFEFHYNKNKENPLNNIYKPICNSMQNYYLSLYNNPKKFENIKQQMIANFTKPLDKKLKESIILDGIDLVDKNSELCQMLQSIKNDLNKYKKFDFVSFIEICQMKQISDVYFIHEQIQNTIEYINENYDFNLKENSSFLGLEYPQLKIIERIFDDIRKGIKYLKPEDHSLNLNDEELLKSTYLEQPLSKFVLFKRLIIESPSCISISIPRILFNDEFISIMKIIIDMSHEPTLNNFNQFISKINSNQNLIQTIESTFPYNLFTETSFKYIYYWMPMIKMLHESEITFNIIILNNKYTFSYKKETEFEATYIFNEKNELILSRLTQFYFKNFKKNKVYNIPETVNDSDLKIRSFLFHRLTKYLVKNSIDIASIQLQLTRIKNEIQIPNINKLKSSKLQLDQIKNEIINPKPNPNQFSRYSLLFLDQEKNSQLISKVWSIIYTFQTDIINLLSEYIHPLEKEMLHSFQIIYESINKNNINFIYKFSKYMIQFGNENSYLWRILNNTFQANSQIQINEAKKILSDIDNEISYLNQAPNCENEIWNQKSYIQILAKARNSINEIIIQDPSPIRISFNNIITRLQEIRYPNNQYIILRDQIIEKIAKDSENNPTKEQLIIDQEQAKKFIDIINISIHENESNKIIWPTYNFDSKYKKIKGNVTTKKIKLYSHVIWFSNINSIFDKIIKNDSENKNIYQEILQLYNFPEMKIVAEILTNSLFQNHDESHLQPYCIDDMYYHLNSQFLARLIKDDLLKYFNKIDQILNSNEKRIELKEIIFAWIHNIVNGLPSDFELSLPHFSLKDFLFMFVIYRFDVEQKVLPGPLLVNYNCDNIASNLKNLYWCKINDPIQYIDEIAKNIFRSIFKTQKDSLPNNHNALIQYIENHIPKKGHERSIIIIVLKILNLADKIILEDKTKFSYNDVAFLKNDWIENDDFINSYPSFAYWLCKNKNCAKQLQKSYKHTIFDEKKLPFWLFALRLMSSVNCITFDTDLNTKIALKIKKYVEKDFQIMITNNIKNSQPIGKKWLNVFLSYVPPELSIQNYRMFYQFFLNLSEDNVTLTDTIMQKKYETIKKFLKNIFKHILDDSLNSIFKYKFNENNEEISFIVDPNKFVLSKIQSSIDTLCDDFLKSHEFKNLDDHSTLIINIIKEKTNELQSTIEKENKNIEKEYIEYKSKQKKTEIINMKSKVYSCINEYKENYEKLLNDNISEKGIQICCNNLISNQKNLPDYLFKYDADPITCYKFLCIKNINEKSNWIKLTFHNPEFVQKWTFDNPCFFKSTQVNDYSIQKVQITTRNGNNIQNNDKYWTKFKFYPIVQSFDIDDYVLEKLENSLISEIPVLILGKNYTPSKFIEIIHQTTNEIISFVNEMKSAFSNKLINDYVFSKPGKIIKRIDEFTDSFTAKLSNDGSCKNIDILLNDIKPKFIQIKNYIIKIDNYLKNRIEKALKESSLKSYNLFTNRYELPIPSIKTINCPQRLFRNISNNYVYSPIISLNNDSIICNPNYLECNIQPMIPSLYSNGILLNFISFVDKQLSLNIKTINDDSEVFKSKLKPSKGNLIQVEISLPENKTNAVKPLKISTEFHFSADSLNELILPCDFSFTIVPLSILFLCDQYPISYKKDSFYLCADRLYSMTKLTFSFQNYYLKENLNFECSFDNLNKNTKIKPILLKDIQKGKLELSIRSTDKVNRLNGLLKVKFSDNCLISTIIDAAIIPFNFHFEIYDPNSKRFVSDYETITIYYSPKYRDREIILHSQISYFSLGTNVNGVILTDNISPCKVKLFNIKKEFEINQNTQFDIKIQISNSIGTSYYSSYKNYYSNYRKYSISVVINGIKKTIYFDFQELPDLTNEYYKDYFSMFPFYKYDNMNKSWEKLSKYHNCFSLDNSLFVNPFSHLFISKETVYYYSESCKIENSTNNSFFCINGNGQHQKMSVQPKMSIYQKFRKTFGNNYDKNTFYSIYGISNKSWYPCFSIYPDLNLNLLDFIDDNIEIATKNIDNIKRYEPRNLYCTNYYIFIVLLCSPIVIKNIKNIIEFLPEEIKAAFTSEISSSQTIDIKDPKMIILTHNIIIKFYNIFKERYNEIKNNNFKINSIPVSEKEIQSKIDECFKEYYEIDFQEITKQSKSSSNFKEIEDDIQSFHINPLPPKEEQHLCYLFTENYEPTPNDKNDCPKYIDFRNTQIKSKDAENNIQITLPKIDINKLTDISQLTIPELNNIYNTGIQVARLLPNYVRNMITQKNHQMEQEAIECFKILLQLYQCSPEKDYSFISSTVNSFNKYFISMIKKFQTAGINFNDLVPNKHIFEYDIDQDFIQLPEKKSIYLPQNEWITDEKEYFYDKIDIPLIKYGKIVLDDNQKIIYQKQVLNQKSNDDIDDLSYAPNKESENENEQEIELKNFISETKRSVLKENEENKNNNSDVEPNEEKQNNKQEKTLILPDKQEIKIEQIKCFNFDGLLSKLGDTKEMIERAVTCMQIIDVNSNFKQTYNEQEFNENKYKEPEIDNFPIDKLISESSFLTQTFLVAATNIDLQFYGIAVNLLIDCSSNISKENKLFNMMIICALTQTLNILEIPYSATVFSDKDFLCTIKSFEEDHSHKCLQRICDCLLIDRYRSRLACSVSYAINKLEYKKDDNRQNRAIIAFSDGLDDEIKLTKAWSKLLSDDKLSFGFIFIKSKYLEGENLKYFENVWSTFETEVNQNSKSSVNVVSIQPEINDDLYEKLTKIFTSVMFRQENLSLNCKDIKTNEIATFDVSNVLSNIDLLANYMNADYSHLNKAYIKSTDCLKTIKSSEHSIRANDYGKRTYDIATCKVDENITKERFVEFMKTFYVNNKENNAPLETIFKPNKASQIVNSTTGDDFDIEALVINILSPVPDPLIFLEEKGGYIRNYGVTIIIDASYSCFNEVSGPHSFQTVREILTSLAYIDLPCIDIIITSQKNPIVLCSDCTTYDALKQDSPLWKSLFAVLQEPVHHSDLSSALHEALNLILLRNTEYQNLMIVLTDGLYKPSDQASILENVNNCAQNSVDVFGIGIGIYPKSIEKLFPQIIFSPNPSIVWKSIASFIGFNIAILNEMIPIKQIEPSTNLPSIITEIIQNQDNPSFPSLKKELKSIPTLLDAFNDIFNEEKDIGNIKDGFINPVGPNTTLLKKNVLITQKILIVMLWDCTLNKESEESFVSPEYINKPSQANGECIQSAVSEFGITLKVVQNYADAIFELTKQTKKGFCDYYACWVFCGPQYAVLPDKHRNPNLVGHFNEVLKIFHRNGGSIVFWTENDPLYYQANLFLESAIFESEECENNLSKLRIQGFHKGGGTLLPDEEGKLTENCTFNKSKLFLNDCQRATFGHNIGKIFEGISIAFASNDLELIKPFKPFARDSEGGISILFYVANQWTGTGDIIIDCGFTKCFTEINTDGTFRYLQNIAAWTARPEIHKKEGFIPSEWRPKAVEYTIKSADVWKHFLPIPAEFCYENYVDHWKLQTLWAIDSSGSVRDCDLYHRELKKIIEENYKENDEIWLWDSQKTKITEEKLRKFYTNKEGGGSTESSLIAEIAQSSSIRERLIITTDGHVNTGSIERADEIMKKNNIVFKYVSIYIIGTGGDKSVGAPYVRNCPNDTFYIPYQDCLIREATLSKDDLNTLQNMNNINSYDDFNSKFVNLQNSITAATRGTDGDNSIQQNLVSMKQRITNNGMNQQQNTDFDQKYNLLYDMATGSLKHEFKINNVAAAQKK